MTNNGLDNITLDEKIVATLSVLKEAFTRYKPHELFLSFNGGKDCTVLLDLVVNYLKEINQSPSAIAYIYVQPADPFEEVEKFVKDCENNYQISMQIHKGNLKSTLERVLKDGNQQLKGCFLGSRKTDPYCGDLKPFQMTDHGWPELMRINPLLEWNCDNVWKYLLDNQVPYCSLYDVGYTSIGDRTNTIPNPHLQEKDTVSGEIYYRPAYTLENAEKLERAGRK